jgi:hypothetical protein
MGYSQDETHVRVDFFKEESGKWYTTEELVMPNTGYRALSPVHAVEDALIEHLREPQGYVRMRGMTAVVLEPHHQASYPVMIKVEEALDHVTERKMAQLDERATAALHARDRRVNT